MYSFVRFWPLFCHHRLKCSKLFGLFWNVNRTDWNSKQYVSGHLGKVYAPISFRPAGIRGPQQFLRRRLLARLSGAEEFGLLVGGWKV